MPKTFKELMGHKESNTPFEPIPAGDYLFDVANAIYEESRPRNEGDGMVPPRVRTQLKVVDRIDDGEVGAAVNRVIFHDFYIDQDASNFGFALKAYRMATGSALGESLTEDMTDNDSIAQVFAAGLNGGQVTARIRVTTNKRTGDEMNVVSRWVDAQ